MAIFAVSLLIFRFFLQKCFLSSPLWFIWILSKSLNLIGCHGNIKGKFSKNYSKIFSSEAVKGMKLGLCIHVNDISLYTNYVFTVVAHVLSLLWQLKISIDLQLEKWKLAFISVLLQIFWKTCYRNVSGVVLYQPYEFCPNRWFWLVAMATERLNLRKKIFKNLCVIILYINCVFYCYCACGFVAMATLSFHRFIMGKSESRPLFLSDFRYFDKSFTVMFLE